MAANWLLWITNAALAVIESLYSSCFLQIIATSILDPITASLWLQSGSEVRASTAWPGISATGQQDLPALATLWAYLTQKHRDNAGPELFNNPVLFEAARDG